MAGTAKNTGKTTTMTAIMQEGLARGWRMCLTSIGFDGEEIDNVTGLPKPRVHCEEGMIVATARRCLDAGSAKITAKRDSGIDTALGRVIIGEVQSGGLVVLAGPNKSSDLETLLGIIRGMKPGPDIIFVDGAFGRIAPMGVVDCIIIATGAARNQDIARLAAETVDVVRIFQIPGCPAEESWFGPAGDGWFDDNLVFHYETGATEHLNGGSLLGPRKYEVPSGGGRLAGLLVPGAVEPAALEALGRAFLDKLDGCRVVFSGPTRLLVSGNPSSITAALDGISRAGAGVCLRKAVPLLGVTINPFYPLRVSAGNYEGRFVDRDALAAEFRGRLNIPVWDVAVDGASGICDLLEEKMRA